MCWSVSATIGVMAVGAVATVVTVRRRDPPVVPLALGSFTLMEAGSSRASRSWVLVVIRSTRR